ncbi:hypothetical protein BU26DRAFT_518475 [Trematosphaeria pertusa]|uniref:Uncharacterized protein n=1 Tax=Trematosphaeria pertusa TaxID=390896 RepID=A0A6A6IHW2_9PLEO|nr:uncharacterized protein BU26DRAFT_518475 [Trematosphaeria pertusa]KAF2250001.1 hypothetical protein BU26DRAFT_518475 [Trematosphaeria pertusa]
MIISDAGDWTRSLIRRAQAQAQRLHQHNALLSTVTTCQQPDAQMQMRFWVKSSPKAGVLSLSAIFPRVILLTTGSGIGPCLSSLLDRPATQFARLIWSTRSPIETYGEALYETVLHTDPDALVIDTTSMERPDLVSVAWRMYQEVDAEAVFVLSNAAVTRKVVYGLESRGVPAFGPIWDS